MTRLLVIPAAGRGSRLGWSGPKALCPVGGRPLLAHLFSRYAGIVDRIVVVASPEGLDPIRAYVAAAAPDVQCVVQPAPTGMLPAIQCARDAIEAARPEQVWVTWCDQIAISAATVNRLAREMARKPLAALAFPTVSQSPPYIHFMRDAGGTIVRVLQRREGDDMPSAGESDAGLFALRLDTFLSGLADYDRAAPAGSGTHERNFLPFIPWLASRALVRTFPAASREEAVGVNTPDDVRALEAYFSGRV